MISPDRYDCLGELLRDALIQFKSETALIEVHRKRERTRHTYADLQRDAMTVAQHLEEMGVGAGDRVAILMSNQSRWLIGAYGALYRGAVLVPLDYKLDAPTQAALLAHAAPKALLIEQAMWQRFDNAPDVPAIVISEAAEKDPKAGITAWEELRMASAEPAFVPRSRDDVACIVYSSGTSGRPKGCMLTHDNYLEQFGGLSSMFPMETGDRFFSILPTNHAIDFMVGFIGPLSGGATIVHQRTLRPEFINWTMKEYEITHMALVPLVLEAFERSIQEKLDNLTPLKRGLFDTLGALNERLTERAPNHRLSSTLLKPVHAAFGGRLKMLFCGGAFVDRKRAEFFYRLGIPVVIGYGLTEACTVVTVNDLKPFRGDSVGRAVPGVQIRIDAADVHGVGEVLVQGRTVMKGYLDDPEQTIETIQDGWLRTGDLGWLDAADHLHLVGRSKNMIVTAGGKNIYPEDVETVFDGVPCEEMAVFATNYIWPGGKLDEELLLAVVRPGKRDEGELRDQLRKRNSSLPDFKRVRGLLEWDEEFPRTASMKLKRQVLAEALRDARDRSAITPV